MYGAPLNFKNIAAVRYCIDMTTSREHVLNDLRPFICTDRDCSGFPSLENYMLHYDEVYPLMILEQGYSGCVFCGRKVNLHDWIKHPMSYWDRFSVAIASMFVLFDIEFDGDEDAASIDVLYDSEEVPDSEGARRIEEVFSDDPTTSPRR
ncbi:hypothetical protein EX30DRAFT_125094 [Ascodesmis nigricans]|uniref:Uncharacterized protein n=1 Tax=Ascodesmis nigricans TaxID=341454 RepID=A0A4S2MP61_9PEZI|nr:hypothetical protein EX30DRAFT_125094 [Ascodesmis nigricans]